MALASLTHVLPDNGIGVTVHMPVGESLITRARNKLARDFLRSDATHMMFLDADINFQPEDVVKLARSGHPLIGGIYPRKEIDWRALGHAARNGVADEDLRHHCGVLVVNGVYGDIECVNDCIKVREIGTGFLLIAREVFEKIAASEPENVYQLEDDEAGSMTGNFFETRIRDGRLLSEDYWFVRRAMDVGYQPMAHIGVKLGHIGIMEYRGDISSVLQPKAEAAE